MRAALALLLAALLLAGGLAAAPAPAAAAAAEAVTVDAGDGAVVRVEPSPFRVALLDREGRETVATVPGRQGAPVRAPGVDGPQPAEPLGALGGFPALGWVTGARVGTTMPLGLFAGNRLFGAEAGGLVSVTGVRSAARTAEGGARLELETDAPGAPVAQLSLDRLPGGGVRLDLRPPAGVPAVSSLFTLASPDGEGLYGLGARKDAFDQRGRLRNVWVEQQNAGDERAEPVTGPDYTFPNGPQAAYYVQSSLLGSRGWAAWVGTSALQRVDLAASRSDAVRWGVATPGLTLHLAGGGLERASAAYTADTGRAPAPPRYVYEPWIDVINEGEGEAAPNGTGFSGGERVKRDLEEIVRMREELDIPIGVLGVEGWHAIPGGEAFFAGLREKGLRLSAYWNPFTSPRSPVHAEAAAKGYFIRDGRGQPFPILTSRNTVVNAIDFTNPEAARWWRTQLQRSNALGFEAFMHDFGEFVTEGMVFHDGSPPELAHNRYPVLYHQAARAAQDAYAAEHPGFEPWFYVRAGFDGATRATSGVFPGDETTDWAQASGLPSVIPAMLNLALTGANTFTTDVGGYFDFVAPRTTPELLIRWSQLAAFTPVSRIHNSTDKGSLMPWEAGEQAVDAYRRYARAKVRLIDLVDAESRRASREGTVGPVRPLVLEDPSPAARSVEDEWLLGRDLLVAPVIERGARERRVYLPAGARWERVTVGEDGALVPTGEVGAGGTTITAPAPLADIPVFRRVEEARRCASRRSFSIRLRVPRRAGRVRRASVFVNGRRVKVVRGGGRLRAPVDLRGLPRGRFLVRVELVTARGRRVLETRAYRTCTPRRSGGGRARGSRPPRP